MNKDFGIPQRQAPVGVAVLFVRNLRVAINILIAFFAVRVGGSKGFFGLSLVEFSIIIGVIFFVYSVIQWRKFFFYVQEGKFVLEKGVLQSQKTTVPFSRIQTVSIQQNLIQRILNVVSLKVDTAGSSKEELHIRALSRAYARQLQEFLIEQKEKTNPDLDDVTVQDDLEAESAEKHTVNTKKTEKTLLVKLGIADLIRVGLTENHLRNGIVLFAIVNGYLWQYEEYLLKPFEGYLEEGKELWFRDWMVLLPAAVVAFAVVSVLFSLIRTTLKYYGLSFLISEKGAEITSGLLERREYQLPVNKIQYFVWKSNPFRRLIRYKTLIVKQASSEGKKDKAPVNVPGIKRWDLRRVYRQFYPELLNTPVFTYKPHILLFVQRAMWFGVLPALVMVSISVFSMYSLYVAAVLYLILAVFFSYKYALSVSLKVNDEVLRLRKGYVYPQESFIKFYKLQNVALTQSIFQKRRGLMSVRFYTASGSETMYHLPMQQAYNLYNYALYKIESSEKSWM